MYEELITSEWSRCINLQRISGSLSIVVWNGSLPCPRMSGLLIFHRLDEVFHISSMYWTDQSDNNLISRIRNLSGESDCGTDLFVDIFDVVISSFHERENRIRVSITTWGAFAFWSILLLSDLDPVEDHFRIVCIIWIIVSTLTAERSSGSSSLVFEMEITSSDTDDFPSRYWESNPESLKDYSNLCFGLS